MSEESTQHPGIAKSMAHLAQIFIDGAREDGFDFSFERADAAKLDMYFDALMMREPTDDIKHALIMTGGAYLGELLVHVGGAHWSEEDQAQPTLVLENGMTGHPLDKVAKRVHIGSNHSLAHYAKFVFEGADPTDFPGAHVHNLKTLDEQELEAR